MKKVEKELYIKHAKRLEAILNKDSTFVPFLSRADFVVVVKNELNVLAACEKLFPKTDLAAKYSSAALVKEFNTLSKSTFVLDPKFKYEDEADLIDAINYLAMFCKNMFKVNIDDLVEGKKVVASNPTVDLHGKPEPGDEPMMDAANAFNMGAMGYSANPMENPYLMGKAYAKLNEEIRNGNVYQYKTKPKAVPIAKLILTIMLGLTVLAVLLAGIFAFIANGLQIANQGEKKAEIVSLATITNGVFDLVIAGFGSYTLAMSIKSMLKVKGKENENQKYSFSWPFYLCFLALAILITIFDIVSVTGMWKNYYDDIIKSGSHWVGFEGWSVLVFIVIGFAGLSLIPMIIGAVKAPKQDKEKLEGILHQYIDAMAKNQPSPNMDVQAPVKVEEKKEEKPSDKKPDTKKPEKK